MPQIESLKWRNNRREVLFAPVSEVLENTSNYWIDTAIDGQKLYDLSVDRLNSGTIKSKKISLEVANGDGDSYIASGKTDFATATAGFILGVDDSDDMVKLYLGDATNYMYWDGTNMVLSGSVTATSGAIGGWIITTDTLYSLASGTPTSSPSDGVVIDSSNPQMIIYEDTAKRVEVGYLSSGVYGIKGYDTGGSNVIFELSDTQQIIAGWSFDNQKLSSGSVSIDGSTERILMGAATAPMTGIGIFLGKDGTDYEIRAGNPAGSYLLWDGSSLTLNGATVSSPVITGIQSGSEIAIQGWQFSGTFSATDYRICAWTAGTVTLMNGVTYSISAGNTGNMAALTYIYLDIATSTTAFQVSTTAADAVGSGKILVAVAQNNTDTTSKCSFQVFGGTGGQLLTVDSIAANSASTNEFISNTAQIKDLIVTNAKINDLAVSKLTAGTINSQTITLSASTSDGYIGSGKSDFTTTNAGFILGADFSDSGKGKLYLGDTTNYLYWDGTSLVLTGNAVVDGSITVGKLSTGNSPNLLPAEWADFEQYDDGENIGVVINGAATCTDEAAFGSKSMKMVASSADNYVYFGSSNTNYNIKLKPSTKYIVSAYIKGGTGSEQVDFYIKQDDGTHQSAAAFDVTSSWARYYKEITTDGSLTDSGILRIDNDDNGATIYVDAVQVEEASTTAATPEPSEWKPGKYALAYDPKKNLSLDLDFFWNHNMKQIATCDSDETWADNSWDATAGTVADDTTNYFTGDGAKSATVSVDGGGVKYDFTDLDLTKFKDGSTASTSDYIIFAIYIATAEINKMASDSSLYIRFPYNTSGTVTDYYSYGVAKASLSNGWNYFSVKKSDFTSTGSPAWSSIKGIDTYYKSTGATAPTSAMTWTVENIQLIRNNGSDHPNPFMDLLGAEVVTQSADVFTIIDEYDKLKIRVISDAGTERRLTTVQTYKNFEVTLSFRITQTGNDPVGILVGGSGTSYYAVTLNPTSNAIAIVQYSPAYALRASTSYTESNNTDYAIKATITDGVITGTLFLNGQQVVAVSYDTSTDYLNGYTGIFTYGHFATAYSFNVSVAGTYPNSAQSGTTIIDGGSVYAGSTVTAGIGTNVAGLTGQNSTGTAPGSTDTDIRIWAGDTFANRATAPFRVRQDGVAYATDLTLSDNSTIVSTLVNDIEFRANAIYEQQTFYGSMDDGLTETTSGTATIVRSLMDTLLITGNGVALLESGSALGSDTGFRDFDSDWVFYCSANTMGGNGAIFVGLHQTQNTVDVDGVEILEHIGFYIVNGAVTASNANGSTQTTTSITGLTMSGYNVYSFVVDGGASIKFYVNGTLRATHTTNMPSTQTPKLKMGINGGGSSVGVYVRNNYILTIPI